MLPSPSGTYEGSRQLQSPPKTLKQTPLLGNDAAAA